MTHLPFALYKYFVYDASYIIKLSQFISDIIVTFCVHSTVAITV